MILLMTLLTSFIIAMAPPPALEEALDQLTQEQDFGAKARLSFAQTWEHERDALIDTIAARLHNDPAFAVGTEARTKILSILIALHIRGPSGAKQYDDPRIIDIFVQEFELDSGHRNGALQVFGSSAPRFHDRVVRVIEPQLLVEMDAGNMAQLMNALERLTIPPNTEVMKRLEDIAFDPNASKSLHYPPPNLPEPASPQRDNLSPEVRKAIAEQQAKFNERPPGSLTPQDEFRLAAMRIRLSFGLYDDIDRYPQLDKAGQPLAAGALMMMFGRTKGRFDGVEEHQIKAVRAIGEFYSDPTFSKLLFADDQMTGENFAYLFAWPLGDNTNSETYRREVARVMLEVIAATKDPTAIDYAEQIARKAGFNPQDLIQR